MWQNTGLVRRAGEEKRMVFDNIHLVLQSKFGEKNENLESACCFSENGINFALII